MLTRTNAAQTAARVRRSTLEWLVGQDQQKKAKAAASSGAAGPGGALVGKSKQQQQQQEGGAGLGMRQLSRVVDYCWQTACRWAPGTQVGPASCLLLCSACSWSCRSENHACMRSKVQTFDARSHPHKPSMPCNSNSRAGVRPCSPILAKRCAQGAAGTATSAATPR